MRLGIPAGVFIILLFSTAYSPETKADGPVLSPVDLEPTIASLTLKNPADPVKKLESRLLELNQMDRDENEKKALAHTLGLIRILRTTRITTPLTPAPI
jgi:hypothetical protein